MRYCIFDKMKCTSTYLINIDRIRISKKESINLSLSVEHSDDQGEKYLWTLIFHLSIRT